MPTKTGRREIRDSRPAMGRTPMLPVKSKPHSIPCDRPPATRVGEFGSVVASKEITVRHSSNEFAPTVRFKVTSTMAVCRCSGRKI